VESWGNLLLDLGPVAAVAIVGWSVASAIAFWQFRFRGWKISLAFAIIGAIALAATYLAIAFLPTA
jgi:hypothetical protein